jgi:two-component system, NarL family, response regulator DevR
MMPASPAAPDTPTVLVVDPSRIVREWLGFRLGLAGFRAVEAAGGAAALAIGRDAALAAAVLEVDLPDADGVDVCAALRQRRPGLVLCVLTTRRDDDVVARAVAAGARGYLLKDAEDLDVPLAIRALLRGEPAIDPRAASALVRAVGPRAGGATRLSQQELQVLRLAARGLTNAEIGRQLHLSRHTVKEYLSNAMRKLGVRSRVEAALEASRQGLLGPDDARAA